VPPPQRHSTTWPADAAGLATAFMPPDAPQLPRSAPLMLIHATASMTPETPLAGNEGPTGMAHLLFAATFIPFKDYQYLTNRLSSRSKIIST